MLAQIQNDNNTDQVTMVSLELVDYINDSRKFDEKPVQLRHADFMAKVPKVLGWELSEKFRSVYTDTTGRTLPCYRFPKREACLMAMSYSYELQAQIFDRMTAMENHIAAQNLPSYAIDDPIERAKKWIEEEKQKQAAIYQLELAAPKVAFVDKYVAGNGNKTFRQVAKLLQVKENTFRSFLVENKIMYLLNGEWTAYQNHVDAKRFHVKTGVSDSGHAFNHALFTPKGVEWVAGELAKFNLRGVA
ncbi:phage antirepressor KilAC domain-containing protein [Acinetobacter sp. YH12255]|uniref:phage antirepressor KilAC domain-containing protein n=1 Tax=Acinetobacter sp. YH12255 TaxID=2601179 RepID=UPI001C55306C|nr:phage antirepressor KilAC domain-containing protein [Acinetobacter sp. YH12255]